jgi:transcriptional regulator with XRE-family HTH domain
MQTNVRISGCHHQSFFHGGLMELDRTPGERLDFLLRRQGNLDKGEKYSQYDLCYFLTGEEEAPNGKRYDIQTSRSAINRYVTGRQEMTYEIISAVCEIFDVTADWLLRGVEAEEDTKDVFMTPEAGEIAAIVDGMSLPARQEIIAIAHAVTAAHQAQQVEQQNLIKILKKVGQALTQEDREYIAKLRNHRSAFSG